VACAEAEDETWGAALPTATASGVADSPSPSEDVSPAEDAAPAAEAGAEDDADRSRHTPSEFAAASAISASAFRTASSRPPRARSSPPVEPTGAAMASVAPAASATRPTPSEAPPAADAALHGLPARWKPRRTQALLAALFVLNALVVAGLFGLRYEGRRARLPIAALSSDVRGLHEEQAGASAKLDETRAKLDETRAKVDETRLRLDEQASILADTMSTVAATVQRQKDADREAREHEARERAEMAALASRLNRVEKRTYKLNEAIKLIDLVQGRPTPPPPPGERPIVNP
jgi:hypothetical protein